MKQKICLQKNVVLFCSLIIGMIAVILGTQSFLSIQQSMSSRAAGKSSISFQIAKKQTGFPSNYELKVAGCNLSSMKSSDDSGLVVFDTKWMGCSSSIKGETTCTVTNTTTRETYTSNCSVGDTITFAPPTQVKNPQALPSSSAENPLTIDSKQKSVPIFSAKVSTVLFNDYTQYGSYLDKTYKNYFSLQISSNGRLCGNNFLKALPTSKRGYYEFTTPLHSECSPMDGPFSCSLIAMNPGATVVLFNAPCNPNSPITWTQKNTLSTKVEIDNINLKKDSFYRINATYASNLLDVSCLLTTLEFKGDNKGPVQLSGTCTGGKTDNAILSETIMREVLKSDFYCSVYGFFDYKKIGHGLCKLNSNNTLKLITENIGDGIFNTSTQNLSLKVWCGQNNGQVCDGYLQKDHLFSGCAVTSHAYREIATDELFSKLAIGSAVNDMNSIYAKLIPTTKAKGIDTLYGQYTSMCCETSCIKQPVKLRDCEDVKREFPNLPFFTISSAAYETCNTPVGMCNAWISEGGKVYLTGNKYYCLGGQKF